LQQLSFAIILRKVIARELRLRQMLKSSFMLAFSAARN